MMFLDEENRKRYRSKGFEWRIERDFFWLELVNLSRRVSAQAGNEIKFDFKR